jgi:hypothetical protein
MLESGAGCGSLVLEDQNVAESAVFLEIEDPIAKGPEDFLHPLFGQLGKGCQMVWVFDDDLMGPDSAHLVIHPFSLTIQVSLDLEGGELVGDHPQIPTGGIGRSAIGPVR